MTDLPTARAAKMIPCCPLQAIVQQIPAMASCLGADAFDERLKDTLLVPTSLLLDRAAFTRAIINLFAAHASTDQPLT